MSKDKHAAPPGAAERGGPPRPSKSSDIGGGKSGTTVPAQVREHRCSPRPGAQVRSTVAHPPEARGFTNTDAGHKQVMYAKKMTRGRAVAHIGVELLLDGVLVDEVVYREAYVAGLAHDPSGVRWREPGDDDRFGRLLTRLRAHGVPDDLRRPESIAMRLHRMLAHRPLLAPSPSDLDVIKRSLVAHKPRVEVAADTVVRALRAALTA